MIVPSGYIARDAGEYTLTVTDEVGNVTTVNFTVLNSNQDFSIVWLFLILLAIIVIVVTAFYVIKQSKKDIKNKSLQ